MQQNAPAVVQPLLNAFPLPNGPDLGNGTAGFAAGYSDPSTLNTYGIRADYLLAPKITILGRYSDGPSHLESRSSLTFDSNYSNVREIDYRTQTVTLGSNQTLTANLNNELRFNYSRSRAHGFAMLDTFGGATPPAEGFGGRFAVLGSHVRCCHGCRNTPLLARPASQRARDLEST